LKQHFAHLFARSGVSEVTIYYLQSSEVAATWWRLPDKCLAQGHNPSCLPHAV